MRRARTLREAYGHLFERDSHSTSGLMISEQDVTRLFKWVHLSADRLGGGEQNMFTFTPRIPLTPSADRQGDVVEDDFTRRISVAPTISQAIKAIGSDYLSGFWVYAVDLREDSTDDVDAVDLSQTLPDCDADLSYEDAAGTTQTYSDDGAEYRLSDWLEQVTDEEYSAPSEMPPDLQKSWQGCVPDAYETEEHWLTSPTTFVLLGRLVMNGSKNFVNLTPWAIEELQDYHDHLGVPVPKRVLAASVRENSSRSLRNVLLTEGAKTISDLPPGVGVILTLYPTGGTACFYNYVKKKKMLEANSSSFGGCIGWTRWSKEGPHVVSFVNDTTDGFGPLLYDVAMEIAGEKGLMPDRRTVSGAARHVWSYYRNFRSDVESRQMDNLENDLTPDPSDNILQVSAERDPPWYRSPLSRVYFATTNSTLEALRQAGLLFES